MNALYTRDSTTEEPQDSPDSPTTLEDIIEEERTRLLTAGTVLGCASVAIENDRSANRHGWWVMSFTDLEAIYQSRRRQASR
jgi:hypothetical protein